MLSCDRTQCRGQTPENRTAHVDPTLRREAGLGEPRLQRLVAVEGSAAVEQELGGSAEHEAETLDVPLEHVVQYPEKLLVVLVAGLGTLKLVEVHHLVEDHEQTGVSRDPNADISLNVS